MAFSFGKPEIVGPHVVCVATLRPWGDLLSEFLDFPRWEEGDRFLRGPQVTITISTF